jgi:hypothetical protein
MARFPSAKSYGPEEQEVISIKPATRPSGAAPSPVRLGLDDVSRIRAFDEAALLDYKRSLSDPGQDVLAFSADDARSDRGADMDALDEDTSEEREGSDDADSLAPLAAEPRVVTSFDATTTGSISFADFAADVGSTLNEVSGTQYILRSSFLISLFGFRGSQRLRIHEKLHYPQTG